MTISDPIADMLTRIRNAVTAGHTTVAIPNSKLKSSIAKILKEEGYISGFEISIITTAKSDDAARRMLQMLGMPFRKDGE